MSALISLASEHTSDRLLRFSQTDIHETAGDILRALFAKIRTQRTPQKIAENEYLMKCELLRDHSAYDLFLHFQVL